MASVSAIDGFSPATRDWFGGAFDAPTAAQEGAWAAAQAGRHALVVAPTGSGKTLAAFLWALDRLATDAAAGRAEAPLPGALRLAAQGARRRRAAQPALAAGRDPAGRHRLGLPVPDITVGIRTGDTPADERRLFARTPPDVLVTTPESLFLILTSAARESLRGVQTVILDEVHAVAGTKRGAHLALSLERLDELLETPRTSGSGCRPPCARSTRCRPSWRARGRSRWCSHPPRRRSRSPSRFRCRTWPLSTNGRPRAAPTRRSSGRRPAPRSGPPSGPRWNGGCWSWSGSTARPSCSPTPGGWPSG